MIKMLRIDDRLVHGQVVFIWSKHLDIKGIVVANDELCRNPIQQVAVKMAVPDHIKLLIKSVDDAIHVLNDPRIMKMNVMVVVKDPHDGAKVMKRLQDTSIVEQINIGNSGRVDKGSKVTLTREINVDNDDVQALRELLEYKLPFHIQMIPTNNKVSVEDALKHYKEEE